MSRTGLSYEQAPPLALPLRFFLTAPLILMLAAVAAIPAAAGWPRNPLSPAALALTHLLTLGVLGQVMVGALIQILPVVIGSPLPAPHALAAATHAGLTLGTLLLASGLGFVHAGLIQAAMVVLATGWLPFLAATAMSLAHARSTSALSLTPMRLAWFALLVTLGLGLLLAGALAGVWPLAWIAEGLVLHAAWGLVGWVLILVMGVAYQVVPMLQLTPPYPAAYARWASWLVFVTLLGLSLAALSAPAVVADAVAIVLGLSLAGFGLITLDLQRRRRRRLADATLRFWRLGMLSLVALAPLPWLWARLPEPAREPALLTGGLVFLLGFAVSVVNGMLYKIVPFLAWFHLQTQTGARAGTIPNMKEFLPEAQALAHWRLHLAAMAWLTPAPWLPPDYAAPGLLLLACSAHRLWRNLLGCVHLFRRHGGRLA